MNIGPFSFPAGPLILLGSVALAVLVARVAKRETADAAERTILNCVILGLVVSRVSFVLHYLPAYHGSLLKMLDFSDRGFDLLPGVVVGGLWMLWMVMRRPPLRRTAIVATLAGFACWNIASAFAGTGSDNESIPQVQLVDMYGKPQPLARNDGKPLVVNLWASWCGPCRREMPVLAQAQAEFTGVDLAFVNQGESPETVSDFLASQGISLKNLALDPSLSVARAVGARAFPTTLFYDAKGKLLAVHLGPFSQATFQNALETMYPPAVVAKR